jgi:hypothetical protein
VLDGKAVFDYLLLPSSGRLVAGNNKPAVGASPAAAAGADEPAAFALGDAGGLTDTFADVAGADDPRHDRPFAWASLDAPDGAPLRSGPFGPARRLGDGVRTSHRGA